MIRCKVLSLCVVISYALTVASLMRGTRRRRNSDERFSGCCGDEMTEGRPTSSSPMLLSDLAEDSHRKLMMSTQHNRRKREDAPYVLHLNPFHAQSSGSELTLPPDNTRYPTKIQSSSFKSKNAKNRSHRHKKGKRISKTRTVPRDDVDEFPESDDTGTVSPEGQAPTNPIIIEPTVGEPNDDLQPNPDLEHVPGFSSSVRLSPQVMINDQEAALRSLIQSRSPLTKFDVAGSPQRMALDWLLDDPNPSNTTGVLSDDMLLQRFALATFWYATGGPTTWDSSLTGWLDVLAADCTYAGLACNVDGFVDSLYIWESGLSGSLPREVALLSELTFLNLYGNYIEGTIPTEVGLMTNLDFLDISVNRFTGMVPSEFSQLTKLEGLYLHLTPISGSVPSNLCDNLEEAWIDCNSISCKCCEDGRDYGATGCIFRPI